MKSSHSRSSMAVKRSRRRPSLKVAADGRGLASHAGTRLWPTWPSARGWGRPERSAGTAGESTRRHAPGEVLVDLAVMLADGGECIFDLKTLRGQPGLFGEVASQPTAWRLLDAIDQDMLGPAAGSQGGIEDQSLGRWPGTWSRELTLDFDHVGQPAQRREERS